MFFVFFFKKLKIDVSRALFRFLAVFFLLVFVLATSHSISPSYGGLFCQTVVTHFWHVGSIIILLLFCLYDIDLSIDCPPHADFSSPWNYRTQKVVARRIREAKPLVKNDRMPSCNAKLQ